MIVFFPDELEAARYFAKSAVDIGSKEGGDFDWSIAMAKLKIALGYAEFQVLENRNICGNSEDVFIYGN
ncbi:hypothetical protein [Erwinia phage Snitter]|nr:hypothetical protein [Erwinia phage Snitter]